MLYHAQIFHHLDNLNARVYIERDRAMYVSDDSRWIVRLELLNDDTHVQVRKTGPNADQALGSAYRQLVELLDKGLPPAMKAPQLEHHGNQG